MPLGQRRGVGDRTRAELVEFDQQRVLVHAFAEFAVGDVHPQHDCRGLILRRILFDRKIIIQNDFRFSATVQLSPVFLGWCCSFGDKLRVVEPYAVIDLLNSFIMKVEGQYQA